MNEYSSVGGAGVIVGYKDTEDLEGRFASVGIVTKEAGNYLSGEVCVYAFIDAGTLVGAMEGAPKFISALATLGIEVTIDDIVLIDDLLVS